MSQIAWLKLANKELLSVTLQQLSRQTQPPSHLWTEVHDLQRKPIKLEWEGLSLSSPIFLKTATGWKTAAKTWRSNSSSASVRAWTFTSLQPPLVGSHLFPQIKAQEKMKWRTSARGLTISLLDLYPSVSGGTSSASVFPFPFGLSLCTESQNASLCR